MFRRKLQLDDEMLVLEILRFLINGVNPLRKLLIGQLNSGPCCEIESNDRIEKLIKLSAGIKKKKVLKYTYPYSFLFSVAILSAPNYATFGGL